MNSKNLLTAAVVAGAAVFASIPSTAQTVPHTPVTTPVNPGFFYWSIGANGGIRHMPTWTYGQTFNFGQAGFTDISTAYSFDPKPWGAGPEFVMGYALNKAGPLGGLGDKPRIELGLSTFFGKTSQKTGPGGTGSFMVVPHVDGTPGGFGYFPNENTTTKLTTTVYAGETALRFKTGFKLSPKFTLSPSIAAIGGMALYRYRWRTNVPGLEVGNDQLDVKETIRSFNAGGELAMQFKWAPSARFSLYGSVAAAAMYRHSHLNARSQFVIDPGGFNQVQIATQSDNRGEFAWRLGVDVGFTYDWGWARVTISGFGYWDSAVPQIENPKLLNNTTFDASPARLTSSGEWAYGGRIAIVFPLYKQPY